MENYQVNRTLKNFDKFLFKSVVYHILKTFLKVVRSESTVEYWTKKIILNTAAEISNPLIFVIQ
jgi:hypothetical protein